MTDTIIVDTVTETIIQSDGISDHGYLSGLSDDDHTQYHNNTRGDARYFKQTEFIATSVGAGDAGKPVVLDAGGNIDATMINDSDIDHASVTNTHNLTTDINHDSITNTHNLTTDIDHDSITNSGGNQHIDWTNTSNNLDTSGTVDAASFLINGTSINTAGALSNVAYENQANTFTLNQTIDLGGLVDSTLNINGSVNSSIKSTATDKLTITHNGTTPIEIDASGNVVFNESGADVDFRVESDNNENMLFVDGGNDRVGIGTATPSQALDLIGNLELEDTISNSTGVIYKGSDPFIHNFHHPTGDSAIPSGNNLFIGVNAGNFTTGSTATSSAHGSYNVGVGSFALTNISTGYSNFACGASSLITCTTGYQNACLGVNSLYDLTDGYNNVALGASSLSNLTSGNRCIGIGLNAGAFITGGSDPNQTSNTSVYIGSATKASADGNSNEIVIGQNVTGNGSNTVTIGNSSIVSNHFTGNVGVEQTTFGTNADKVIALSNGTAPTTSPADATQVYSADQSAGNACLHTRTEGGAVVKLYQQSHIVDADGSLADITTKFNTLLSYLENNGLLASS